MSSLHSQSERGGFPRGTRRLVRLALVRSFRVLGVWFSAEILGKQPMDPAGLFVPQTWSHTGLFADRDFATTRSTELELGTFGPAVAILALDRRLVLERQWIWELGTKVLAEGQARNQSELGLDDFDSRQDSRLDSLGGQVPSMISELSNSKETHSHRSAASQELEMSLVVQSESVFLDLVLDSTW